MGTFYYLMKKILNVALVASLLFFASCEGNTEYLLHVKNNSTEPITLVHKIDWSYTNFEDTIQIAVGETKQIAQWNQLGGNSQSVDITGYISSIYGLQTNSKELDSSVYQSNTRWEERIEEKKRIPANYWHYYELSLTDVDFQ